MSEPTYETAVCDCCGQHILLKPAVSVSYVDRAMTAPVAPTLYDLALQLHIDMLNAEPARRSEIARLAIEAAERRGRESVETEIVEAAYILKKVQARHDNQVARAESAEERIAALEALRKFAKHDATCAVRMIPRRFEPDCSCGLDEALSASDPRVAEPGGKP